jgi:hypothetical protein
MSFKPEVRTGNDPKFYGNNLAFATKEEAEYSARDLMNRWLLVNEWRVVESDQAVNYRIDLTTGELIAAAEEVPA